MKSKEIKISKWNEIKIFKLPYIKDCLDYKAIGLSDDKIIFTKYEIVLSLLLIFHPEVLKDIQKIINKIELREFIPYPKIRNLKNVLEVLKKITPKKYFILESECQIMIEKYNLQKNWLTSLEIMVLTNILPIPYHEEAFEIETNKSKLENGFPFITIKRRPTSSNELTTWINDNWKEIIKPKLKKLPLNKFSDTNVNSLALGLAFGLIGGKKVGWKKVENFITDIEEIDPNFFGINGNSTPDTTELTKLAYESKKKLQEFHSTKSE